MTRVAAVHRLPMTGPSDTSAIEALIEDEALDAGDIVAVLGKTEGNGCVNDFTRGFATQSLRAALSRHLAPSETAAIPMVMSGGTEGGLSPHWLVLSARDEGTAGEGAEPALALATSITRDLAPAEIGRAAQAGLVCEAVRAAMVRAAIATPSDVHFVQIKCPLLTAERIADADGPSQVATTDTLKSMGLSRGASALGVALALGEVEADAVIDGAIGHDWDLFSSRASASAGIELMACEIVVLGVSAAWSGGLRIAHAVMDDAIDVGPVAALLRAMAPEFATQLNPIARGRLRAVLAKAEASGSGAIRGARHTMLDDSDIASTRHARSFVAGALAGLVGTTELFVSGGAEHQGPTGGGPVAIIYEL